MEFFAKIVNGFQLLTIFVKSSILDFDWVLNTPLNLAGKYLFQIYKTDIKNISRKDTMDLFTVTKTSLL